MNAARAPRPAGVELGDLVAVAAARYRAPGCAGVHRSRVPGFASRYLEGLAVHASARGWSAAETLGLIAAVEERVAVWLLRPRRLSRRLLAERWPGGRGDLEALVVDVVQAPARGGLGLAAVSGRRPPIRIVERLAAAGARTGRIERGAADELALGWAIEVALVPVLGPEGLAALREQLAAAPRCGCCRIPVLGSVCRRCLGAGA